MAYGIQGRENPLLTEIKESSNDIWLKTIQMMEKMFSGMDTPRRKNKSKYTGKAKKKTYLGAVKEVR